MKSKTILLTTALLGGLFTASAYAGTRVTPVDFAPPAATKIVAPTGLPRSHIGAIVRLQFTVDAAGQPRDIHVVSNGDQVLAPGLVAAVSQWRFTPGRQNGVAVSTKVEMPLELLED